MDRNTYGLEYYRGSSHSDEMLHLLTEFERQSLFVVTGFGIQGQGVDSCLEFGAIHRNPCAIIVCCLQVRCARRGQLFGVWGNP